MQVKRSAFQLERIRRRRVCSKSFANEVKNPHVYTIWLNFERPSTTQWEKDQLKLDTNQKTHWKWHSLINRMHWSIGKQVNSEQLTHFYVYVNGKNTKKKCLPLHWFTLKEIILQQNIRQSYYWLIIIKQPWVVEYSSSRGTTEFISMNYNRIYQHGKSWMWRSSSNSFRCSENFWQVEIVASNLNQKNSIETCYYHLILSAFLDSDKVL